MSAMAPAHVGVVEMKKMTAGVMTLVEGAAVKKKAVQAWSPDGVDAVEMMFGQVVVQAVVMEAVVDEAVVMKTRWLLGRML